MKALRAWKLETLWFVSLCALFATLATAKSASAMADEYRWYDPSINYCARTEPLDCLFECGPGTCG
jgi:hypothetical protein